MRLEVPYYSQFVDITDPFWMLRACGAASLKMVLEYHGRVVPPLVSLCDEAHDRGGYDMSNGWVHDYLVTKAQELGVEAHREEGLTDLSKIITSLESGNPVIVSVEKRVLEQKRFHIIVLTGYESKTDPLTLTPAACFYYHEPESTDKEKGKNRSCDVATFMEFWRGKAIFISKKM